jgi:hypothetical protein
MTVYRIAKWAETFERAESRKLRKLAWVSLPIDFGSTGYHALLEEFEEEAAALYGAWCVLTAFAATCPVRGLLANSKGTPFKLSHLARVTGFSEVLFQRLLAWASQPEVGWLEVITEDDSIQAVADREREFFGVGGSSGESPDVSGDRRGNPPTAQEIVGGSSGESPDVSGDRRGNPPTAREIVGGIPRIPNLTKPNQTRPDITSPDITQPDQRVDGLEDDGEFVEQVVEVANRFARLRRPLPREMIWQVAWVGCLLDRDTVNDACDRIAVRGSVNNPKKYLATVMRNLCQEHGKQWQDLRSTVPAPPPPTPSGGVLGQLESAIEAL